MSVSSAALDQGINFVDTADMYSRGESEEIVGKALKGRRDDVVLATKVHFPLDDGTRNRSGNSRRWIVQEVENSLRRLDTDWIDLYQIHRPDYSTDIEETLWVLTDLVSQGKDPRVRVLDLPGRGHRDRVLRRRAARIREVPDRATSVLADQPGIDGRCCRRPSGWAWVC